MATLPKSSESLPASYRLVYFDARGRAEVLRYLFALSRTPYDDVRVPFVDWPEMKTSMPFEQLPVLQLNGDVTYCQSGAIMRYLGHQFGLYGATAEDELLIDEVWGVMNDVCLHNIALSAEVARSGGSTDAVEKRQAFFDAEIPRFVAYLERRLEDANGDWLLGDRVSAADAMVYEFFTGALDADGSLGQWRCLGSGSVARLVDRFGSLPEIAAHVANRHRTAF